MLAKQISPEKKYPKRFERPADLSFFLDSRDLLILWMALPSASRAWKKHREVPRKIRKAEIQG